MSKEEPAAMKAHLIASLQITNMRHISHFQLAEQDDETLREFTKSLWAMTPLFEPRGMRIEACELRHAN